MALTALPTVGVDIGSSAIRAAQVSGGRGGMSLTSFGQVALPQGAVVDGEIADAGAVSEAISRLMKVAKIKTKRVVIGVANQRVVVRQVDLPFLEEKEFRSSLRYQVADQIPMPVESAELDFQIVDDYITQNQDHMMRVLLVAAATEMVEAFVAATAAAGVEPVGVDLTPFAVARAVSASARGEVGTAGAEAIVDIGAGVTNVLIHQGGEPRFVRILLVGGDNATRALSDQLGVSFEQAEAMKFDLARGFGAPNSQSALDKTVQTLVSEIRGSLDYYLSQEESQALTSVIVTGGGSLTAGLAATLEQSLRIPVHRAAPLSQLNVTKSGLSPDQIAQIEPVAAAAVGLAMGAANR